MLKNDKKPLNHQISKLVEPGTILNKIIMAEKDTRTINISTVCVMRIEVNLSKVFTHLKKV